MTAQRIGLKKRLECGALPKTLSASSENTWKPKVYGLKKKKKAGLKMQESRYFFKTKFSFSLLLLFIFQILDAFNKAENVPKPDWREMFHGVYEDLTPALK